MYSNLLNKLQKVLVWRKLLSVYSENSNARNKMCFHNWCFLNPELKLTQVVVNKVMAFSYEQLGSTTVKYSTSNREGELSAVSAENSMLQHEEDLQENHSISKFSELVVDLDTEKKILLILMEYEMSKQCGIRVPSMLTLYDMKELLTIETREKRSKFMGHLFIKEARKRNEQLKKEERRKAREIYLKTRENNPQPEDGLTYGLGKNSFFLYIRESTISRFYNHRQANAMLYGSKIVVDLDYDQFMVKAECQNCSYQLAELHGANKRNKDPFELYFCNANPSNLTVQMVQKQIPNMTEPNCFINLTESSYLDIFPKNKLVYLSPHAKEALKCYDPDAVYIIGGIVDKSCHDQVSIAKVKREGLKTARLPLDEYLLWGLGSKALPLNLIMEIMLEIKNTGEWDKALRFVPRRKLKRIDSLSEETYLLSEKAKQSKRLTNKYFIKSLEEKY